MIAHSRSSTRIKKLPFSFGLLALAGVALSAAGCEFLDDEALKEALRERERPEQNPCATVRCASGHECVVLKSNPPQAQCQPVKVDENPCAATLCKQGQICVVAESYPPQARCVDPEPQESCRSSEDCPKGLTCSVERGDCRPGNCKEGQVCAAVCTGICEAEGPAGACKTDADCRLEANYCGGCGCEALGPGQSGVACSDPVQCFRYPCEGLSAVCVSGGCRAIQQLGRDCSTQVEGGGSSCKPSSVWRSYANDACERDGRTLGKISFGTSCGKDSYREMKYECCS